MTHRSWIFSQADHSHPESAQSLFHRERREVLKQQTGQKRQILEARRFFRLLSDLTLDVATACRTNADLRSGGSPHVALSISENPMCSYPIGIENLVRS